MPGRTSAPYAPPHSRIRPIGRTSTARGIVAAVIAAATLLLAANAGPARAAGTAPAPTTAQQANP
ncbi:MULTISPECIES: hypothetical protein [Streptomyces]|uniref:Uncharacterized protein n=2 Tax=Streptomyces TaxID=1883 RepID=A0A101QBM7_STRCK|nr:hypothetical protein [Streptomyces corchorusii]KUN26957.1 hypothetical protein AQJ11_16895 [Streptomyces corchorusii]